jgi:uncharacterized membrane protein
MNQTHIHLITNHLAIIGAFLGTIILIAALLWKSVGMKAASYLLFIISAAGAIVTYLTGEPAEEAVENIAGISKDLIEKHEDFATIALISLLFLGLISIIGMYLLKRKSAVSRTMTILILVVSLISFTLAARTGYLGGQIRHTEVNQASDISGTATHQGE